ncbi:phenylacetic acid degradation operon negative regulatory protein [Streptosporangium becharense]|uniref:Phenylacetic acid degradation operon negative regulatory protein n=1 Tax=Streptosporangium becharense TaxID=1816182 RepID=A0A7W9ME66_9ACTN|nr:PaaX family transcriptional regulator C-terminal domain-containing protein [Streptosporangium becharense]MBB2915313.1 phenylacetic acid degradation operon negative regulatory protein [Streptosporangium becharense]MBB5816989.1 phenylacetic acid degradation operon negative regulatory protein [Streptosporangium becharense]
MADDDEFTGRGQTPRALIVTVYGLYAREVGGWMSVASVIRLLGRYGVDAPSVRSAVFRLKRRGLLVSEKKDGVAGYALSQDGHAILREGDRRIFERRRATLDDGWLLAIFSVPETERDKRHQLRSRLSWLGFGTVSAGVWIAPAHLLDETKDVLTRHGLASYVNLFQSHHVGFEDIAGQAPAWWDLARLQALYQEFLDCHGPVLERYKNGGEIDQPEAFTDYIAALTDWRRLPYSDPGLAVEVLPGDWNGVRAADTFFELHERLAKPAHEFVESVLRTPAE